MKQKDLVGNQSPYNSIVMEGKNQHRADRPLIIFSSLLRWTLGLLFIILGFVEWGAWDAWALWLFGLVFIITGFLRPKRCLDEPGHE